MALVTSLPDPLSKVEVYDDVAWYTPTLLATLWDDATETRELLKHDYPEDLSGVAELEMQLPWNAGFWTAFRTGNVLRSTHGSPFVEHRIRRRRRRMTPDGALLIDVLAQSIWYDLVKRAGLIETVMANGQREHHHEKRLRPADQLAFILSSPHVPDHFTAGQVQSFRELDMVYHKATPGRGIEQLAELAHNPRTDQMGLDVQVARDDVTNLYHVGLLEQRGEGADTVRVEQGVNMRSVEHTVDDKDQATRVWVFGSGPQGEAWDMGLNLWRVSHVDTGNLRVYFSGEDAPFLEDDQLNGFLLEVDDRTTVTITDTVAGDNYVVVDSLSGTYRTIEKGMWVRFLEPDGSEITSLRSPTAEAAESGYSLPKVVDRPDVPAVVNLLRNPFFDNWTAGGVGHPPRIATPEPLRQLQPEPEDPGGAGQPGVPQTPDPDTPTRTGDDTTTGGSGGGSSDGPIKGVPPPPNINPIPIFGRLLPDDESAFLGPAPT